MTKIISLKNELSRIISNLNKCEVKIFNDDLIKAKIDVLKLLNESPPSISKTSESYNLARQFLDNEISTLFLDFDEDRIAFSITDTIAELGGKSIFTDKKKFYELIQLYYKKIDEKELWHLTWYNLFLLYLRFDYRNSTSVMISNWEILRVFLLETFAPLMDNLHTIKRPWMMALESNLALLGPNPYDFYINDVLNDRFDEINKLSNDLSIPRDSWFWQKLTVAVTDACINKDDNYFVSKIPFLLKLITEQSIFRDDCIVKILGRYHIIKNNTALKELRDYVIDASVWKNPKLKYLGIATKWTLVSEEIWKMVLTWVTAENLKMFFSLIQSKGGIADDRLQFWIQYSELITWSKFALGKRSREILKKSNNPSFLDQGNLYEIDFSKEEDFIAELQSSNENLDAFIMEIGNRYFVEFSVTGNAVYYYEKLALTFDINSKIMSAGTEKNGLKSGSNKIRHVTDWQEKINQLLNSNINQKKPLGKIQSGSVEYNNLINLVLKSGYSFEDLREKGGRLWVEYPYDNLGLADDLKSYGFCWAQNKKAWYLKGDI